MATPKPASKMHVASRVCKLSAWVIAALGIVVVIAYVSTILPVLSQYRQNQDQSPYAYTLLTSLISALFLVIVPTLFFTVVLYALGTLMEYMTGAPKPGETEGREQEEQEEDDERLEIVPIPDMR